MNEDDQDPTEVLTDTLDAYVRIDVTNFTPAAIARLMQMFPTPRGTLALYAEAAHVYLRGSIPVEQADNTRQQWLAEQWADIAVPTTQESVREVPWSYQTTDSPKALRETLCVAQAAIALDNYITGHANVHIQRLQRLIDDCDKHRPVGPDGKHGNRHTATCGCETTGRDEA